MSLSPGDSQDTVILTCVLLDSEMTAVRLAGSGASTQINTMNIMLNGRCIATCNYLCFIDVSNGCLRYKVSNIVADGTVVGSISSSFYSQSVVIDRVEGCVQYELTGLITSVFLYCDSIYCPLDSCGRSSMSTAGDSEFRNTCSELSV